MQYYGMISSYSRIPSLNAQNVRRYVHVKTAEKDLQRLRTIKQTKDLALINKQSTIQSSNSSIESYLQYIYILSCFDKIYNMAGIVDNS